jgi:hypothetical protein
MNRLIVIAWIAAGLSIVGASAASAAPVTKQNGKTPAFRNFTSICAVAGYADYGNCNGNTTTYTDVTGRINAVQPKAGTWNLGLSFTNLQPGATYRLWGNRSGPPVAGVISGFFQVSTVVASAQGSAEFSYQTGDPANLGFDLNILRGAQDLNGITVVTSYWSSQALQIGPSGTLDVPGG